jgi:hypothetical protein
MNKNLQAIVESSIKEMQDRRMRLAKKWGLYVDAAAAYIQKNENRTMTDFEKGNIAQCLDNALFETALRQKSRIFETTYGSDISFLGIQLPVIAALLPSLVLNKIGIVQALDRRTGSVFFLDVQYGDNKGSVVAGSPMMSSISGHDQTPAGRTYASTMVENENLGTGNASKTVFFGTLAYPTPVAGSVQISNGVETFVDNGAGVLVSDLSHGTNGTITSGGAYSVTFKSAPSTGQIVYADYQYDYQRIPDGQGVPEVNFSLTSSALSAIDFPLRAKYALGAAIDLEKAHGLVLEDEVVKYLGGEIKFEIDHYGIDLIEAAATSSAAAAPIGAWSATVGQGQEWFWVKYQFLDYLEKGSNNILSKTLKGFGNFIVCGNDVKRVIVQLKDHFKPAGDLEKIVPTGPYEVGTLDGRLVIHDPFMSSDEYVMGFKGDNYLFAGMIYAPYIPLFSTPTLVTSDLVAQKGFLSASGFKMVNEGMYTFGTISGLG